MKHFFIIFLFIFVPTFFCNAEEDDDIYFQKTKAINNGTGYTVTVNSFGRYNFYGKTFYIESGTQRISSNDVEFITYADYIRGVLVGLGAKQTQDKIAADICFLFDYDMVDESYQELVSVPIWGPTGISSISTTSTTSGIAFGSANANGYATASGNSVYGSASSNGSVYGSSTTNTNQNINYNYGITGMGQKTVNVEKFNKILNLYAYDNQNREGDPVMLWKINACCASPSDDLSFLMPYMSRAILNYVGTPSMGKKNIFVNYNEADVALLKAGLLLYENAIVNPKNGDRCSLDNLVIRCILDEQGETHIILIASQDRKRSSITVTQNTYLIYKGQKYPIIQLINIGEKGNLLGKRISLNEYGNLLILQFPVQLEKNDSFELVSFSNKKETKELFHFYNVRL